MRDEAIQVTVTFLGLLRDQMGRPRLELELPAGSTYRDLLDALAPVAEARLCEWAWDRERREFSDRVKVSHGRTLAALDPVLPLADGEELIVFPPVAGG